MKIRLATLFTFLLFCCTAWGQTSQITISLGATYANGILTETQIGNRASVRGATLDGSGAITINNLPQGGQWFMLACTSLGTTCKSTTVTSTGLPQDISASFTSFASASGISGLSANCVPKAATATTITGCSSISDDGTTLTTSNATVTSSSASPLFITSTSADVLLSNTAETHAFGLEGAVYGDFPGGSGQPGRFQVDLDTDFTHIELLESTRLAPTLSGCSFTAQSSNTGFLAGSYHSGTTGTCTVTFTMPTVTTGWYCSGKDITTPADVINTTASSASGCTLSGTTTTGDVIVWMAIAF